MFTTSLFSSLECFLLQSDSSCHSCAHLQYLLSLAHAFLVLRLTWKFSNAFHNINPIPPAIWILELLFVQLLLVKSKVPNILLDFFVFDQTSSCSSEYYLCCCTPALAPTASRLCTLMVLPHPILVWYKAAWSTCLLLSQIPVDIPALSVCLSAFAAASHLLPPRLCAVRWHIRPPAILNAHTPSNPQSNSNSALLHAIADWHICQTFSIWHIS